MFGLLFGYLHITHTLSGSILNVPAMSKTYACADTGNTVPSHWLRWAISSGQTP
jgi:hypothetical protein